MEMDLVIVGTAYFFGLFGAWILYEEDDFIKKSHDVIAWPVALIRIILVSFWRAATQGWR